MDQLDWDSYRTKHEIGCSCSDSWLDANDTPGWIESTCEIIRKRGIPLVLVQRGLEKTEKCMSTVQQISKVGNLRYVAISHVWSE